MNAAIISKILAVGIGATLTLDAWSYLLGLFNIKSLDYRYVGRWIGNFPKGRFFHHAIFDTPPIQNELVIGWVAHYLIGITFAFLLMGLYGKDWLSNPALFPAVITGIITLPAPLFVMQPAFGFGIASANLPNPNMRRFKSLTTHMIYGVGLYITALLIQRLLN